MKKVITYGTFDLFHQGHYNILKRAREYGDYLIVGVTSESYDIERGKLSVHDSLTKRIKNVMDTGFVDQIIVEEYLGQKIRDIAKYDIDTLVIGSDWRGKFDHLNKYCKVVYLERTKNISSTQIRESHGNLINIGIITDCGDDMGTVEEIQYVSGFHISNVFSESKAIGQEFCKKHQIGKYNDDFEEFLADIDVAIVLTKLESRYRYIREIINAGKHVISETPLSISGIEVKNLFDMAKEKKAILIENFTTIYLRAFLQILWITQSDIIGDIYSIKCSLSKNSVKGSTSILHLIALNFCMAVKLMGSDIKIKNKTAIKNAAGDIEYFSVIFSKGNTTGIIEIFTEGEPDNNLKIIGENAYITVENDWWNAGYFEVKKHQEQYPQKYSYNFEGNGFRYIAQEVLIMIQDGRYESTRLFREESEAIVRLLNEIQYEEEER